MSDLTCSFLIIFSKYLTISGYSDDISFCSFRSIERLYNSICLFPFLISFKIAL
ncbi:MAG: hypothetical protein CM15mP75_4160 [Flammeovirgaceae bacterium]|nr:MAG: hypothetical protein CM15mP75_4160 [Flammeovirgaceae bacterium]